jgi:hypothetical protein
VYIKIVINNMSAQSASSVAAVPSQEEIDKCRMIVANNDMYRELNSYLGIDGLPPPPNRIKYRHIYSEIY